MNQPRRAAVDAYAEDFALREAVARQEAGAWAEAAAACLRRARRRRAARARPRRPMPSRPVFQPGRRPHGRRIDRVGEFHPAWHRLMQAGRQAWRHRSFAWRHAGRHAGRARRARGADVPALPGRAGLAAAPHHADLRLRADAKHAPRRRRRVAAADRSPHTTRAQLPAARKTGRSTIGMGMTEKQGGSDVRAQHAPRAHARRRRRRASSSGHKWFYSAPMCDALAGARATAQGGADLLPVAALACPTARRNCDPHPAPEGQARQLRATRQQRDRVRRRAGRGCVGEEGRGVADHPRDGRAHAARLHDRQRRAHAPGAGAGAAPRAPPRGVRQARSSSSR